jgi:hypothetical protein
MTQQLVEKERIARSSLDTTLDHSFVSGRITPCHCASVFCRKRSQVDRRQGGSCTLGTPHPAPRVTFDTRGQDQKHAAGRSRGGKLSKIRHGQIIGPVKILDDYEARLGTACALNQEPDCTAFPSVPGRVVHGIIESTKSDRLWQAEQVVQKDGVLRVDETTSQGRCGRALDRLDVAAII